MAKFINITRTIDTAGRRVYRVIFLDCFNAVSELDFSSRARAIAWCERELPMPQGGF